MHSRQGSRRTSGWSSPYYLLRPEVEIEECVVRLRRRDALRSAVHRIPTRGAGGAPLEVAVEERGSGSADRVVVLVHGVLAERATWRFMVGALGEDADVLLVDLPGCGESESPDPALLAPEEYSPEGLAGRVLEAVAGALAARERPPRVALVGHSLGAAVILRMLGSRSHGERHGPLLSRVDRAVLLAPMDVSMERKIPDFVRIAEMSRWTVNIASSLGILRHAFSRAVLTGVSNPDTMPREEVDRLCSHLSQPGRRRAMQEILQQSVPFTPGGRPDWPRMEALAADYARIRVPCLLVAGARDENLPPGMPYKMLAQLPDARLRVLPLAMHSLPTERPDECAALVRAFVADGGAGWPAYGVEGEPGAPPRP